MGNWLELLKEGVSPEALERARQEQAEGRNPVDLLLSENLVSPPFLLSVLSRYYSLPSIQLQSYHPDEEALFKIPEEVARRFLLLPLFQMDSRLYVAVSDPEDLTAQDFVGQLTGLMVEPIIATRQDLETALNRFYLTREKSAVAIQSFAGTGPSEVSELEEEMRLEDEDAPAVKLVNYILSQAVNMGASDIHMEPFADRCQLRYRVDGVLHEFPPPPFHLFRTVVARIKIISNLDVAERRLPQDGRASVRAGNRDFDLRISIIPSLHGEGVSIRLLETRGLSKKMADLGFSQAMLERYGRLILKPYGIILVTGPTGSGKTTTLYATLRQLYTPKKNIITLEDPVEYQLEGITQIQIHPEIDFTFAAGLRSVLRHDPDIVMLGEIRDLESAEIAIRSSLTGHLVLSTLHTNDAPTAVTRLLDMGIQHYLVFASLLGVVAQRLVRRLCPECKVKASLDPAELASLGLTGIPEGATIYRPSGCPACGNLGYKGRTAVSELLEITPEMRSLPPDKVNPDVLRELARKQGFVSLRENSLEKLFAGVISLEDLLTVTMEV